MYLIIILPSRGPSPVWLLTKSYSPRYLTADDWTSATSNSGTLAVHNADNNDNPGDSWQRADADPLDDDVSFLIFYL